jgi:UDP-glucose 6-dehydrogenase
MWSRWRGKSRGVWTSTKVVVEKSTVPVYTSLWIRTIIMRKGADPSLFDVASNPESLAKKKERA